MIVIVAVCDIHPFLKQGYFHSSASNLMLFYSVTQLMLAPFAAQVAINDCFMVPKYKASL